MTLVVALSVYEDLLRTASARLGHHGLEMTSHDLQGRLFDTLTIEKR